MRTYFLIIFLLIIFNNNYGDYVNLVPKNVTVSQYKTFNIKLIVNASEKLGGFEDEIYFQNGINITNISLSDIANTATRKNVDVSNGKVSISLFWSNNQPSGNFTIATLKFKALKNGTYLIIQKPKLSDTDGNSISNIEYNSVNVTILGLNQTVVEIYPINPKLNENFDVIVSIKNSKELIKNISGTIYYPNLKLINLDFNYLEVNISKINLSYKNNSLEFFVNLNTSKNSFDLMKLTFFTDQEGSYFINASVEVDGNKTTVHPANFTIGKETSMEKIEKYVGFPYLEKNITYGKNGFIYIEAKNIDANISEIKGKITYNQTLLKVKDISSSLSAIDKNWSIENDSIDFYIKTNGTISGNFNIISFWIQPIKNENITTKIKISNLYLFDKNGNIVNVPLKDTVTIHIISIGNNSPPIAYFTYEIVDNYDVNFYSLCYDNNNNDELKYYWSFGDGENSTDANPSHRYRNTGAYIVKLKVNDSLGATAYDEAIVEIRNITPVNISFSNTTFYTNATNITLFCNITLKNPFSKKIHGYIYFYDYTDYKPNKTSISFELMPNETKIFVIPINLSKSTQIKGSVVYFMPFKRLIKYIWNFNENIVIKKPAIVKYKDYYYNLTLNQSKIVIKINKIVKNYTITKKVEIIDNDPITNFLDFNSFIGFLLGLFIVYITKRII